MPCGRLYFNGSNSGTGKAVYPPVIATNCGEAIIPGYETSPILMDEAQTVTRRPRTHIVAALQENLDYCGVSRKSLGEKADAHHISE